MVKKVIQDYFYLAHGEMSLECLKGLVENNYAPAFVCVHKNYEYEKLKSSFFEPVEKLCRDNNIFLHKVDKISEIKFAVENHSIGVCVGFMEIIKKEVFDLPKYGILNLHCGKLPLYRGRAPISRSLMNGENYLTMTLHNIDEGVDSGDIAGEHEIEIDLNDDVNTLYKRCAEKSADFIIDILHKITDIHFVKQDLSAHRKANKKVTDEERKINWENGIEKIFNLIRALTIPYPCAFSSYNGKNYKIIKSEIFSKETCNARKNGEIYFVDEDYILIICKDGLLRIFELRDEKDNVVNFEENFHQKEFFV
jgi:methionyl-tRNA formyltransferase